MNYRTHFLDFENAFASPVTLWITVGIGVALVLAPLVALGLGALGKLTAATRRDVLVRSATWAVIAPAVIGPILLGRGPTVLMVAAVSLWCYGEYARATGVFRDRVLSALVAMAIVALAFASADNYYRMFVATTPITMAALAAAAVLRDTPAGYIQRVALSAMGFLLLGSGLGHLGLVTTDAEYRPLLCVLILCVQINDIFAYCCGKAFGRRHLFPRTSPNKTLGGHLGALVLTAPLAAWLLGIVLDGTPAGSVVHCIVMGVVISVGGQIGDLVLGSIKRDVGIKDMSATLPGHGGVLDRFNSMMLVAPAVYHYVAAVNGPFVGPEHVLLRLFRL